LSITKSIIEKMHGEIGFAARDGGGTVFFFTLPRAP
jgi:signal transduction histidine kinase